MGLADSFLGALGWAPSDPRSARTSAAAEQDTALRELSPVRLARACCEVLPVAGAGITMDDSLLRLPLGSSDETSAWVERLQASLGDGPCVDAMAANSPVVAGPDEMLVSWPEYSPQVLAATPFRSVAAFPLVVVDGPVFGALSLFAATPDLAALIDVDEVRREVADLIAGLLAGQLAGPPSALDGFGWGHQDAILDRRRVWMAVAVIEGVAEVGEDEALATLRGHAARSGVSLDEMARRLIADAA